MAEISLFIDEYGDPLVLNKRGMKITDSDTDGPKSFYVGILITPNPDEIKQSVNKAFVNLKNNIGNNEDKRTIERGYFHASFDSHLAKSTLATELSTCNFSVKIIEYNKEIFPTDSNRAKKQKEFHFQALLTSLSPLPNVYEKINLIIAERLGSMESSVRPNIIDRLTDHYDFSLIETPHLPYKNFQFNNIKVEKCMTKEPVLQAIDFALWAKRIDNWPTKMNISYDEYICIKNRGGLAIAEKKRRLSAVEQLDLTRWLDSLRKMARNS